MQEKSHRKVPLGPNIYSLKTFSPAYGRVSDVCSNPPSRFAIPE